jgi:hypothetical protein
LTLPPYFSTLATTPEKTKEFHVQVKKSRSLIIGNNRQINSSLDARRVSFLPAKAAAPEQRHVAHRVQSI